MQEFREETSFTYFDINKLTFFFTDAFHDLIHDGKTYIPKNLKELQLFRNILSEIIVLNNGTLLKQDKVILPAPLINNALSLAHSGAYPGQNGLIRRLRANIFNK